jgi:ribosomal protein S18 acetylase RimI-like enzyme
VKIEEYAEKIFKLAVTFEAWVKGRLVGLIAAYFNNPESKSGFITNVSVIKSYTGRGIAAKLLMMTVDYANQNHFSEIKLEVDRNNSKAIGLYTKFGFQPVNEIQGLLHMKRTETI